MKANRNKNNDSNITKTVSVYVIRMVWYVKNISTYKQFNIGLEYNFFIYISLKCAQDLSEYLFYEIKLNAYTHF